MKIEKIINGLHCNVVIYVEHHLSCHIDNEVALSEVSSGLPITVKPFYNKILNYLHHASTEDKEYVLVKLRERLAEMGHQTN